MTDPRSPPLQDDIIAWLCDPATHDGQAVEHIETHISHLFLVGNEVFKMKRAIRLAFVDFSTLERRETFCRAEIAINSRTAPEIYRDAIPVTREGAGFALHGTGDPVEWLVRMWRFDDTLLFDQLAQRGELTVPRVLGLADAVAELHLSEMPVVLREGIESFPHTFHDLLANLRAQATDTVAAEAVAGWATRAEEVYAAHEEAIFARAMAGHVRHCHGDLHLRNICEIEGRVRLFDAIEFDPHLSTIDTLYDFAFALMDLIHRDLKAEAALALSRYLGATRDYGGLGVLPLYMSTRAAVRGLVALLSPTAHAEAMDYLDLATGLIDPPQPPRLIAVGGRSGTGKTTTARGLAGACPAVCGGVMIRSDSTRKRLAGIAPEDPLPPEAYTEAATEAVYARMIADARIALDAGACVILDATFLEEDHRDLACELAMEAGVPFTGIWLTAEDGVLAERLASRGRDASDADLAVLRRQREPTCLKGWRIVGADDDLPTDPPCVLH